MNDLIFDIQNMKCAYPGKDRVVLRVEELRIPRGQMVFMVGPSGIGKSTILEALGFMNRTVTQADKFEYCGNDMRRKWDLKDADLSRFRRKEFSFIFQNNNLMNNFTAAENVKITALFQGKTVTQSMLKEVFEKVEMGTDKMNGAVTELSGGQRQRLAFARAILPDFNVLFGDEPTGNLDPDTAETIMKHLHNVIKEQRKGSSAIIVSHDMRLAVKFADTIVRFHKRPIDGQPTDAEEQLYYGLIDRESIYRRQGDNAWTDNAGNSYTGDEMFHLLTAKQHE